MRRATFVAFVLLLVAGPACVEPEPRRVEDAHREAISTAGESLGAVVESLAAAAEALGLDRALWESDASVAALAASEHAGAFASCATVSLDGSTVTLGFGPAPGCELPSGAQLEGSLEATFSAGSSGIAATLVLHGLAMDDRTVDGSLVLQAGGEGELTVAVDLEAGGGSIDGFLLAEVAGETVTVDGELEVASEESTTLVSATAVVYTAGDCYPSGGVVVVTRPPVQLTFEMDHDTTETGEVVVSVGRRDETLTLPPHGDCPSS